MKLTIIHTTGSRAGTQRSISGKAVITLGRHPDNDLVFDAADDEGVSGFHAEIRISERRAQLVDKGSTNGTFVNGDRVQQKLLDPSDVVTFGPHGTGFRVEYAAPTIQPAPGSAAANAALAEAPDTDVMAAPSAQPLQPPAPQQQAPSDKKYGQRTVGVLIQQALAQAGLVKQPGTTKSTEYFEAMVESKVKSTSRRNRLIIFFTIVALLIGGTIFAIVMWRNRSVQVTQQFNYGDAAGSSIASQNRYAVFMLAGTLRGNPGGELQGFCTGFAVTPDLLATNAHCVLAAQSKFSSVYALMNGVRQSRFQVTQMVAHPGYTPESISPDVALMRVNTRLTHLVTQAPPAELAQVTPGAPMFLYGFPGRLNKEEAPEATFIKGDIGRVTTFDQELGDFGNNTLLQHSAYSTGGTSGSPMFNSAGHVIGVNAGGYVEAGEVLHGYNFGMRIDLLYVLYGLIGAR